MNLVIATRKSQLAQVQTDTVISVLNEKFHLNCEKLLVQTEGDRNLDTALSKLGGKGLFVKDIELALLEGRADAAVHSMKDVPYEMRSEFEIAAMPLREDVRDAFVSMKGLSFFELPVGAKIGTSSLRRDAQLKRLRPDIQVIPIRGNVQTRIDKIEKEDLDGIILAAAGLKRLGMENIITDYFDPLSFLPAVGQGALGVQIVSQSCHADVFRALDNKSVRRCVEAERSFMKTLNGGCHVSIGAYAVEENHRMHIAGMFQFGNKLVIKDLEGNAEDYVELGRKLAEKIISCS